MQQLQVIMWLRLQRGVLLHAQSSDPATNLHVTEGANSGAFHGERAEDLLYRPPSILVLVLKC